MSLSVYLSFIVTCFVIEATPGPNMGYLAVLSAGKGRRAGLAATLGIALGLLMIGFAAALGVAALISNSPAAYHVLRWGGVAYLLWLAWEGWSDKGAYAQDTQGGILQNVKYFRRGLIVNLLNPKAAVFYVAILPGFITVSEGAALQAIFLTVTYVTIATFIHGFIVALAGTMQKFMINDKRRLITQRIFAFLLAGIAVWFAVTTGQESF